MPSTLSSKQARFVGEYLIDFNGTRAAIAAGYGAAGAAVAAHRLLRNEKVRAEIEARQGVDSRRLRIGREQALEGLLEAIQMAKVQGDAAGLIAGWREVAKLLGLYAPERRQVAVDGAVELRAEKRRLEAMTDAELEAMAAG